MRATAKKTPQAPNGSPALSKTPKSQPQLPEAISEEDRLKLKLYLDKLGNPFTVATAPLSRKRKRDAQAWQIQDDLWDERLSVQYEVKPRDKWQSLRRYKKFTVGSESIVTGQCILVKFDDASEDARLDIAQQWKAKVLEVRALDSEHVFIRVAWLNRPEDLDSGRKEYHGKNELIPTNQMDVIDAMAVNGTLEIVKWDDSEENDEMVNDEQYFWRQTYDHANTKTFSRLRLICIDNKPQNPDEMIIQCSNPKCRKWLHVKCIAENAVQLAADEAKGKKSAKATSKKRGLSKNTSVNPTSPAVATSAKGALTSEVFIKGMSNGLDESNAATDSEIVITSADGERQSEDLSCLHCGEAIED